MKSIGINALKQAAKEMSFNIYLVDGMTYMLLQMDKVNSKGFWYSFLNAFGSLMIMYSLAYNWNLASFVIKFWIV